MLASITTLNTVLSSVSRENFVRFKAGYYCDLAKFAKCSLQSGTRLIFEQNYDILSAKSLILNKIAKFTPTKVFH